jgi:cytosine deaminase
MPISPEDQKFLDIAIAEAQEGFDEGGIPIGACLVSKDGKVIAKGRNLRMQKYPSSSPFWVEASGIDGRGSATLHGETCCLENAGRLPASVYKGATMVYPIYFAVVKHSIPL